MNEQPILIQLGKGAYVDRIRILAVIDASKPSVPLVKYRQKMFIENKVVDVTKGRAVKAYVLTDSNHLFLCSFRAQTIKDNFAGSNNAKRKI